MSSPNSAKPKSTPVVPRPSASIIVVNSRNEILLVQRNPNSRSFASAYVFPGGNYDAKQDDSLSTTAIRELFEEAGLLLAAPAPTTAAESKMPAQAALNEAREAVHAQKRLFRDFLAEHGLQPDAASLLPFTQWITPAAMPRRFHTQFYVAFLRDSAGFSSGAKEDYLPTPDGGREVVAARFVHPRAALAEFRAHRIAFVPPQFYLLTTLADVLEGEKRSAEEEARVRALSAGAFGRLVINPVGLKGSAKEGQATLTYEGDEVRGGKPGRRHRSVVRWGQAGAATDIELERNFDIFSDIDGTFFPSAGARL